MRSDSAFPPASSQSERWLWVLFAAAWLAHVSFALVGWDNTLLGPYQFRQLQTALSTLFYPDQGFHLDYETPLFGPPWSIPLELPLLQWSASRLAAATGLHLDAAGRLASWLYFQLSLPAVFLLLGSFGVRRSLRWLTLALLVTSPLYLFYSRCFLIESPALCAGLWFFASLARAVTTGRIGWMVLASVSGAAGAAIKVTSIAVIGVGALLWAWHWYAREQREAKLPARVVLMRLAAAFALPVLGGLVWLVHAKAVRAHNPDSDFLNTHFGFWSFGDLEQRLSLAYWRSTLSSWVNGVTTESSLVVACLLLARLRRSRQWAVLVLFGTFLSGQLIFSNLYKVHDYYFFANGVFLIMAIGMVLSDLFEGSYPAWCRWAVPVLLIVFQLVGFSRTYLADQSRDVPTPELAQVLHDLTRPDDTIVILGNDWDSVLPYYAQRRALMLIAGRERDPAAVRRSVERLDRRSVGALVILGELEWNDRTEKMFGALNLDPKPLLFSHDNPVAVWFPKDRIADLRDKLPSHPYATLEIAPPRPAANGLVTVGQREIKQRKEFDLFTPRPVRASVPAGIAATVVGNGTALNTHSPTELAFTIPQGARQFNMRFGMSAASYSKPGQTDGVEFQLVHRPIAGPDRVLFSRLLNPTADIADQGVQHAEVSLPSHLSGELLLRTLPGPAGSYSYDWAYIAGAELQ